MLNEPRKITLLGTGLMGTPMSRNLMAAGHELTVWNRSAHRTAPLVEAGANAAATAAEAISGADVIISILTDGYATQAVLDDDAFQAALKPGIVWIDMASTKPEHARAQSAQLAQLGVTHLDAPVSGGTKGAEAATLAIMVGGEIEVFEQMEHVLSAMGRPVRVGPSGCGQLCKLANQAIVGITIAAVAEATLLVERGGADPSALRAALKGGFADSVILQQHGERMSQGNFAPGGVSTLQLKDLDNTLAEAASINLELPATQAVRDRFFDLCENLGGKNLDHSALYLELKKRNHLE